MVVDPESTQLEETQATVLRRIHDMVLTTIRPSPPPVDTPYDALMRFRIQDGQKFEKWKPMKYHKSLKSCPSPPHSSDH
jgi:hypothetical protein